MLEAFKNLLLLNVLVPLKRLLASLPWAGVVGLIALAGLWLGGWRLALLTGALAFLIAATGQWEKAMTTVYLCGIAVAVAMLIGVPIGILAAERPRLWPAVQAVIDTLQTLPSFVYLMPVVMLFQVGDFTAILAVVLFAIARFIGTPFEENRALADDIAQTQIAERTAPVGRVAVSGADNSQLAIVAANSSGGAAPPAAALPANAEETYKAVCATCHTAGIAGAPKSGDKTAWAPRIAQGNDTLYTHAIKGFQGKAGMMPPKGGNMSLKDEDVKAAVDYMVSQGK